MQFKELKTGATLYVYDRNAIELSTKTIASVSMPRMERINNIPMMLVDVSADGQTYTFKDTDEIGCFGSLFVSADKEKILREVETQKSNNLSLLNRVDAIKAELPKIESVLDSLNPSAKEKKMNDERLNRLESSIGNLTELVENLLMQKPNGTK